MADNRRQDEFGYGFQGSIRGLNKCFECGVMTTGLHHVIPVSRGGVKQLPLCSGCHNRAHDCDTVQPELVKQGLVKARARGVTLGATVKLTDDTVRTIVGLRAQGRSYKAIASIVGVSVGSVFNALREILGPAKG